MQRLIAKYGSATHLALLSASPLFLFPFVTADGLATVLLWLSIPAAAWTLLSPSVREGEFLSDARQRTMKSIATDPLTWVLLVVVTVAGLRALNTGIGLSYDAETAKWFVDSAHFPIFPGSVGGSGYLPFAASLALAVVLLACRHSLGLSARMCFLMLMATLGGLAAVLAVVLAGCGNRTVLEMATFEPSSSAFAGLAFAVDLICGTVALMAAFERKWNWAMVFFVFAIGGTAAGMTAFAPAFVVEVFAVTEAVVLAYAFFYASGVLRAAGEFKMLVLIGISLTLGGLLLAAVFPEGLLAEKLSALLAISFYPEDFLLLRGVLSGVALKVWLSHLWIGTGVGSFVLDFRFAAAAEDWLLVPGGAHAATNLWWQVLAERGIVGMIAALIPFGFLLFTYVKRLVLWLPQRRVPHPVCLGAFLVTVDVLFLSFFDCSLLRADALLAFMAFLALSAGSFPKVKRS